MERGVEHRSQIEFTGKVGQAGRLIQKPMCQSARDRDPVSAPKRNPFADVDRHVCFFGQRRFLKRQLSLPVSTMSQW